MSEIVVADTGPLIALSLCGLPPHFPTLFQTVYIPDSVTSEALRNLAKPGAREIERAIQQGWILRRSIDHQQDIKALSLLLDPGEAEAITMAKELDAVVLLDESRGRKVASKMGVRLTGSCAVLVAAKRQGLIMAVKPSLELLAAHGYRLSPALVKFVLTACRES